MAKIRLYDNAWYMILYWRRKLGNNFTNTFDIYDQEL